MKKALLLSLFIACIPLCIVNAQSETTTKDKGLAAVDTTKNEIVVRSENGGTIMEINKHNPDAFSISICGVEIEFGKNKKGYSVTPDDPDEVIFYNGHNLKFSKGYRGVLEWGFNNFSSPDYSAYPAEEDGFLELNSVRSLYLGWNIIKLSTSLNRTNRLHFSTGLGLVWRNLVFADNITLARRDRMVHPKAIDHSVGKSKLSTFSLQFPLLLESKIGSTMFVSVGVYGDFTLGNHVKHKRPKVKERSGYHVNTLQGGATARIGVPFLYIFGNYGLTEFFQKGKGPQTRLYTIGFNILI